MKYADLYKNIYSLFGSAEWILESVKTYPSNFTGVSTAASYIRVAIVASGANEVRPLKSVSGQLVISIFIPSGQGPNAGIAIADKLDGYLSGKSLVSGGSVTQFSSSTLIELGRDRDNASLHVLKYSIDFSHYGV